MDIAKKEGLAGTLKSLGGNVTLHVACHARAQNMGMKGADMLRLIPDIEVKIIERCSGHGGLWGVKQKNFNAAIKVGKSAVRRAIEQGNSFVVSECPLACDHLHQGMEKLNSDEISQVQFGHPIELFARACGIVEGTTQ